MCRNSGVELPGRQAVPRRCRSVTQDVIKPRASRRPRWMEVGTHRQTGAQDILKSDCTLSPMTRCGDRLGEYGPAVRAHQRTTGVQRRMAASVAIADLPKNVVIGGMELRLIVCRPRHLCECRRGMRNRCQE